MDLQILFNNPRKGKNPAGSTKEKGMAIKKKKPLVKKGKVSAKKGKNPAKKGKKRNPVAVYQKTEGTGEATKIRAIAKGKINVLSPKEIEHVKKLQKSAIERLDDIPDKGKRDKLIKKTKAEFDRILAREKKNKERQAAERTRMLTKGWAFEPEDGKGIKPSQVSKIAKKILNDAKKAEQRANEIARKAREEVAKAVRVGTGKTVKKKPSAKMLKKLAAAEARKKNKAKKARLAKLAKAGKKKPAKKSGKKTTKKAKALKKKSHRKGRNPFVETMDNAVKAAPKKSSKKVSKKKTSKKKTSKKKTSKKSKAKKAVSVSSQIAAVAAPKKKSSRKGKKVSRKSSKKGLVKKASKVSTKKKTSKKSYKSIKKGKNPVGGSMAKAAGIVGHIETGIGSSVKEIGALAGGAGLDMLIRAGLKQLPASITSKLSSFGITPKMLNLIAPAGLAVIANIAAEKVSDKKISDMLHMAGSNLFAATVVRGTFEIGDLAAKQFPTIPLIKDMGLGAIVREGDFGSIERVSDFSGPRPIDNDDDMGSIVSEGNFAGYEDEESEDEENEDF